MSDHFYKNELYPLQDRVLDIIQQSGTTLYLTGETFLSRFLLNHRFSDDLDFFANQDLDFKTNVQHIIKILSEHFAKNQIAVNDETFVRFFIWEGNTQLKIDFINDVKYHAGQPEKLENGLWVDSWINVLSNKVTALDRNAAKDYVDILFLSFRYSFNWEEILMHAKAKDKWVNEISVSQRLMNFEIQTVKEVIFSDSFNVQGITHSYFETLAKESLHGFDNTLVGQKIT